MNLDPRCIAVEGIGFGTMAMATLGFVSVEVEVEVVVGGQAGWGWREYPEAEKRVRITIRVGFRERKYEKTYLVASDVAGRVAARLLSHKRSDTTRRIGVEAIRI